MKQEREERRELAADNRRLYREKEELHREKEQFLREKELILREKEGLLRENGVLREKLAKLEVEYDRHRSDHDNGEFSTLFDEKQAIPSSSHPVAIRK